MIRLRLGSKLSDKSAAALETFTLGDEACQVQVRGASYVRMPDGRPLLVYLPGVLTQVAERDGVYDILHPLRSSMTNNRGAASGTRRILRGSGEKTGKRSDAMPVSSPILGAADPGGVYRYCRLTEWTGRHMPEWQALTGYFQEIAGHMAEQVPDRYAVQKEHADRTDPAWVVPGTPFTTITVNNSYATGTHRDKGDLETGFSALACLRRGEYEGGMLVFPQYGVGVDMQDGDLLLMDAHQWHGNTRMTCACGKPVLNRLCPDCEAERISVVCYYRSRIAECGSPEAEYRKAVENTERRSKLKGEPDERDTDGHAGGRRRSAEDVPARRDVRSDSAATGLHPGDSAHPGPAGDQEPVPAGI